MYPGQQWTWHLEEIQPAPQAAEIQRPLFLVLMSSDKGTEEMGTYEGDDYFKMFGSVPSFEKHGQVSIQTHRLVEAGARVLVKRLVANNATLANLIVSAKVSTDEMQKTNANGDLLYIDPVTGRETTEVGVTPAMRLVCVIKLVANSVENAKSFDEVIAKAKTLLNDAEGMYPLFCVGDNGRGGDAHKKFKVLPQYNFSKSQDYMIYSMSCLEGTNTTESEYFATAPDKVYAGQNMSMRPNMMKQIKVENFDASFTSFLMKVAEITGYTTDELHGMDILFGKTKKGDQDIEGVIFEDGSLAIDNEYGLALQNGSNGDFGAYPTTTQEYIDQAHAFLTGQVTDMIYNVDMYKIDYCLDANYPDAIKHDIVELADFREDFFFFRDLGLVATFAEATEKADLYKHTKFAGNYMTTYDIYDPFTKKQEKVTMLYSFGPILVEHTLKGRHRPIAGEINGFVITDAIENTVNCIPTITPVLNQKTLLEDYRINYATCTTEDTTRLTVESLYSSDEKYTQCSYINNVMAIQEVVKAVREYCPKIRYQFMEGTDFTKYKEDVQPIIDRYASNFRELNFEYTQDNAMAVNKIFKASLSFRFNDWVQTEIFDIYALAQ